MPQSVPGPLPADPPAAALAGTPRPSREGHLGFVVATLFSRDGSRLFSGAAEGVVRVWDVQRGAEVSRIPAHRGPIMALRLSPDGERLYTASHDGSAAAWDAREGRPVLRLSGHRGGVHALAVTASRVATGGYDGTLRMWDAHTGASVATLAGHEDAVTDLVFAGDDLLVSASRDRTVRTWDLRAGLPQRVCEGHGDWVTRLADAGDGRVLSAGEDGRCVLWDLATGRALWGRALADAMPIWGLALAPHATFAITGGAGPAVRWDLASGAYRPLPAATRSRRGVAIAPDGRLAALGGDDSSVLLYDVEHHRALRVLPGAAEGYLAAAVDEAGDVVAAGRFDGAIDLLDRDAERARRVEGAHAFMTYSVCRLGAERFASGGFDGVLRVWDFRSGAPLARFEHGGPVFSLAASADARYLLSAGGEILCLWDARAGHVLRRIDAAGSGAHTVADVAADASVIVSAGEDDAVRLWRPDGTQTARLQHACGQISAVRLEPGHSRALLADARGRVWAMDLETGTGELLHEAHEDWVRALHVTSDGRYVVSASQNGIWRVYDLATRRLLDGAGAYTGDPIVAATVGTADEIVTLSAAGTVRVVPGAHALADARADRR